MKGNKFTTTIRLPEHLVPILQTEADEIGISLNSYLLVAISAGRRVLNFEALPFPRAHEGT